MLANRRVSFFSGLEEMYQCPNFRTSLKGGNKSSTYNPADKIHSHRISGVAPRNISRSQSIIKGMAELNRPWSATEQIFILVF